MAVRGLPLLRRLRAHHPRPDLRRRHHHHRRADRRHPRTFRGRHGQACVRGIPERRHHRVRGTRRGRLRRGIHPQVPEHLLGRPPHGQPGIRHRQRRRQLRDPQGGHRGRRREIRSRHPSRHLLGQRPGRRHLQARRTRHRHPAERQRRGIRPVPGGRPRPPAGTRLPHARRHRRHRQHRHHRRQAHRHARYRAGGRQGLLSVRHRPRRLHAVRQPRLRP